MILLEVPYIEKDEVKKLGAYWNQSLKKWYVKNNSDYEKFLDWLPHLMQQNHAIGSLVLCTWIKRSLLEIAVTMFRDDEIRDEINDILDYPHWNTIESLLKNNKIKFDNIIISKKDNQEAIYYELKGIEIIGCLDDSSLTQDDTSRKDYTRDCKLYLLENLTLVAFSSIDLEEEFLINGKWNFSSTSTKEKLNSISDAVCDLNSMVDVLDYIIDELKNRIE